MATSANTTATILQFELSPRSCVWNPQVEGFDGLSALLEKPVVSGEVNSTEQPELYNAVVHAIQNGLLVKKTSSIQKAPRKLGIDDKKTSIPNLDSRVSKMMLEYSSDEILERINKTNDVSELQIMIEKETLGKNKAGRPRDNVKDAIKTKIRELDTAVM